MKKLRLTEAVKLTTGDTENGTQPGVSGWGCMSGRGNTTDEDRMGGSTDGRETNRCLIRLEYQV